MPRALKAFIADTFEIAASYHREGNLDAALRLYQGVICAEGRHFEALVGLGEIHAQRGRFVEASRLFRQAALVSSYSLDARRNLWAALRRINRRCRR